VKFAVIRIIRGKNRGLICGQEVVLDSIIYEINGTLSVDEFLDVLNSSGLAERRPVNDLDCIKGMLKYANLTVVARRGNKVVGVARSVTDFHFCCYLSDIAVDKGYQHLGIGKTLIHKTKDKLGKRCKLLLLSAPAAVEYYPKIGFKRHNQAWILDETDQVK
jgi:ribosomal protein S18 acetylase RimI-like enzyme